jgi:hypothetical protein
MTVIYPFRNACVPVGFDIVLQVSVVAMGNQVIGD